jgi:hypothetical protein
MLSKILSALGVAPKTLPQATETLGEAKATLDTVAALFTAAGLNLETLLAAGPDSLKAELEGRDNTTALAEALQENERLDADLSAKVGELQTQNSKLQTATSLLERAGVKMESTPDQATAAFEAFVAKSTTLALAKTGHPPAHVPATAIDDVTPPKNEGDAAAKAALTNYEALIVADNQARTAASTKARTDFYAAHHAQIDRGLQLRRRG